MAFPGVQDIEIADEVDGEFDAAIIMECGDLARTGVLGLDRFFVINIDHHPGNSGYGPVNWFDSGGRGLRRDGVHADARARRAAVARRSPRTSTWRSSPIPGSFHYSSISPRTFDICREALEAGVDPVLVARNVYDSNNMGRLKLFGAVLSAMQIDESGRVAIVYLDHEMARAAGGDLRRHRRTDQPPADGQGDPGGGVLQADRRRRVPREPAVEGRLSTWARWPGSSAAAGTGTPPAARSAAPSTRSSGCWWRSWRKPSTRAEGARGPHLLVQVLLCFHPFLTIPLHRAAIPGFCSSAVLRAASAL